MGCSYVLMLLCTTTIEILLLHYTNTTTTKNNTTHGHSMHLHLQSSRVNVQESGIRLVYKAYICTYGCRGWRCQHNHDIESGLYLNRVKVTGSLHFNHHDIGLFIFKFSIASQVCKPLLYLCEALRGRKSGKTTFDTKSTNCI